MADFDLSKYLASRMNTQGNAPGSSDLNTLMKLGELEQARKAKELLLMEKLVQRTAQREAENQVANENAWVTQLGMDPDSFAAEALNLGAAGVSGTSRVLGHLASGVVGLAGRLDSGTPFSEQEQEAYNRYLRGEASERDYAQLNAPRSQYDAHGMPIDAPEGTPTLLQEIHKEGAYQGAAREVNKAMDISSIVHKTKQNQFTNELKDGFTTPWESVKEGWDGITNKEGDAVEGTKMVVSGLADLLVNAGEVVANNPLAASEYIVENLPQVALGALGKVGQAGLTTSNIGYAADQYNQGIENYKKANNGELPPVELQKEMAMYAASTALAEHIGDVAVLKGMIPGKGAAQDVVTRAGFKDALKAVTGATAKGAGVEGVTEGWQTYAEGEAQLKPVTPEDIYVGATIGAVAGAGLSGGGTALAETAKGASQVAADALKNEAENRAAADQIAQGDLTPLTDPTKPTYAPAKALGVLNAKLRGEATEEEKQAYLKQADGILTELEDRHEALARDYALQTPEGQAQALEAIQKDEAELAQVEPGSDRAELLKTRIEVRKEVLEGVDPKKAKEQKAELDKSAQQLEQARKLRADMLDRTAQVEAEPAVVVEQATQAQTPEAKQEAASKLVVLAMRSPERLSETSDDILRAISEDASNGLSEDQRSYLRKFTQARVEQNKLKTAEKVQTEIYSGGKGMLGIRDYEREIGHATQTGNQAHAQRYLGFLRNFAQDHAAKASLARQAFVRFQQTGQVTQILKRADGSWEIPQTPIDMKEARKNGGFTFSPKIPTDYNKWVKAFETEARALQSTLDALDASVNLAFNQKASAAPTSQTMQAEEQASAVAAANAETATEAMQEAASQAPEAQSTQVSQSTESTTVENQSNEVDSTVDTETFTRAQTARSAVADSQSTAEARPEPVTPKPESMSQEAWEKLLAQVTGPRLKPNPDLTRKVGAKLEELISMAQNAGWQVVGGRLYRHPNGEVAGRTKWQARDAWFQAGMEGRPDVVMASIEQLLRGNNIYAKQRRTIEGMLEWLASQQGESELDEDSSMYDWENLPEDVATAEELAEDFDTLFDPEGGTEISLDEVINPELSTETNQDDNQKSAATPEGISPEAPGTEARGVQEDAEVSEGTRGEEAQESSEDAASEEVTAAAQTEGVLEVFQREAAPEGAKLTEISAEGRLWATFFKQVLKREGDTSVRPLVAVKDFFSAWKKGEINVRDYLPKDLPGVQPEGATKHEGLPVEARQDNALNYFKQATEVWNKALRTLVRQRPESQKPYSYRDPLQEILFTAEDGKLDLPENVKTAISFGAMKWLAETAGQPKSNDEKAINALLGRDEETPVSQEERAQTKYLVARKNTVANSLGRYVVQALGLKAGKNAPRNLMPVLEASLGALALRLLTKGGLVEIRDIKDLFEASSKQEQNFVQLARTTEGEFIPAIQTLRENMKGSRNILDKLFSVEESIKPPSLEPVKYRQKTTKEGTNVPKEMAKYLAKDNAQPHTLRQNAWNVLGEMSDDLIIEMAGGEPWIEGVHPLALRESMQAKQDGLRTEIERIREFVQFTLGYAPEDFSTPFFFEHDMWVQQRVGIANNVFNPQTSKIARELVTRSKWATDVHLDNEQELTNFRLRVLEGLGVNTGNEANAVSLQRMQALFESNPDLTTVPTKEQSKVQLFNEAVELLLRRKQGELLTEAEQRQIVEAVKVAGEGMHSFNALLELAELRDAQRKDETVFKTWLTGEIDGVSNGPILSHLLYGAANTLDGLKAVLRQGGFYFEGDAQTQFNLWHAEAGNLDFYEGMTRAAYKALEAQRKDPKRKALQPVYAAIEALMGKMMDGESVTSAGRKLSKSPISPLVFGSSKARALQSMGETFVENLYKKMGDVADDPQAIASFVGQINTLLQGSLALKTPRTKKDLLNVVFSPQQEKALQAAFGETFGKAYDSAIKSELGTFLERRNLISETTGFAFDLYNATYEVFRKQFIKEELAAGRMDTAKNGSPAHDLNPEQQARFEERMKALKPVVHTATSQQEKTKDAGLSLIKRERALSQKSMYKAEVALPQSNGGAQAENIHAQEEVQKGPGVRMTSFPIHSSDSATSHRADPEGDSLNNHDARTMGLQLFDTVGRNLNRALAETALEYSPLSEIASMFEGLLQSIRTELHNKNLDTETRNELVAALAQVITKFGEDKNRDIPAHMVLNEVASNIRQAAYEADTLRLGVLADVVSVDQYSSEGANFTDTAEIRAKAKEKLSALSKALQKDTETAIRLITNMTVGRKADAQAAPETAKGLVEVLKSSGKVSFESIREVLKASLRGRNTPTNQFRLKLLGALRKTLSADLTIHLVNKPEEASAQFDGAADGWFVIEKNEIYLLSSELLKNPETADEVVLEALFHELTHAALAKIIAQEEANEATNKKVNPAYKELKALLESARQFIKDSKLEGFKNHVSDMQEFVAYGMTDPVFQEQVLNQMQFKSSTLKKITGAMKAFVDTLVRLIFRAESKNEQELVSTGMAAMIANVSKLLNSGNDTASPVPKVLAHAQKVNEYSVRDVFTALNADNLDPSFNDHLAGLLDNVVSAVQGSSALYTSTVSTTAEEMWQEAQAKGEAPFASKISQANLVIPERARFVIDQIEAVVRTALEDTDGQMSTVVRELYKLSREIKDTLKVEDFFLGDWAQATQNERDQAQALYDFLLNAEDTGDGRTDQLSRFVALGLAHPQVNAILNRATRRDTRKLSGMTFEERLHSILSRILAWVAGKLTGTYAGQPANEKLTQLVEHLVKLENKKKAQLLRRENGVLANIEERADKLAQAARDKLVGIAKSPMIQNRNGLIRGPAAVMRIVAGDHVERVLDQISQRSLEHEKGIKGFVVSNINTVRGPQKMAAALLRHMKVIEGERKDIIRDVSATVLESFKDAGKTLSAEAKAAISSVFLRTGAHVLLDAYSLKDMEAFLTDFTRLDAEIQKLEAQMQGAAHKNYYINQSKFLGYFLATGRGKSAHQMLNAHNIAYLAGTGMTVPKKEADQFLPVIDQLASLYALRYSDSLSRTHALHVLQQENARGEGQNGIQMVLQLHKALDKQAREKQFSGQQALMLKGYVPEIHNPNLDVKVVDLKEGKELVAEGYEQGPLVQKDPNDPVKGTKAIYVMRDGGLERYVSGATSRTGTGTRGSLLHNGFLHTGTEDGKQNMMVQQKFSADRQKALQKLFQAQPNLNPAGVADTFMVPVLNPAGVVVNQRYMMNHQTRDSILERDNRFEMLMGALAANLYDKEASHTQNTKVLKALHEIYKARFDDAPDEFVEISPNSPDKDMREVWASMPDEARRTAKDIWGNSAMMVPKELVRIMFGYRKRSLATLWEQDPLQRAERSRTDAMMQDIFMASVEGMMRFYARTYRGMTIDQAEKYTRRAAMVVRKSEHIWQGIVSVAKDNIVIRTGDVLWSNIRDNTGFLVLRGVPLKDILHHSAVAYKGVSRYLADSEELRRLETRLKAGDTQGEEARIRRTISELKDQLARNPVGKLIEEGLLPTIVEDVEAEDDIYSYKAAFTRKVNEVTEKMNPALVTAGKYMLMTHDTPLYKFLRHTTQMSDFVGRYVMYQHLTQRKKNPLSHADAIHEASEAFVNYDLMMHPVMQYLDDHGLMMFTKYFLNIQRVLMKTTRENPLRVLLAVAADQYFGNVPTVLDSSAIARIGNNPFRWGVLELPGTLDDTLVSDTLLGLVK